MHTHLLLSVDKPCSENWDTMLTEDKGRFCGSCAKTVVDFTQMSDQEVIDYLARAGQHVCGRFAPDQLERALPLEAPQPKKQRISWWHLLLAGVLFSGKASAQAATVKPVAVVRVIDTIKPVYKLLPEVKVTVSTVSRVMGGAFAGICIKRTIREKIIDSLPLPFKKQITIYPNPVRKGMTVTIDWQLEAGEYSVGLYSSSGALVQQKIMQVAAPTQVDLYAIPSSLANGIYFMRIARAGGTKVYTRKVEIL